MYSKSTVLLFLLAFLHNSLQAQTQDVKDFKTTSTFRSLCTKVAQSEQSMMQMYTLYSEMAFYSKLNQTELTEYIQKRATFRNQLNERIGAAKQAGKSDSEIDVIVIAFIDSSDLEPFDKTIEKRALRGDLSSAHGEDVRMVQELAQYKGAPDSLEAFETLFSDCKK